MHFVNGCVGMLYTRCPVRVFFRLTYDTAVTLGHIGAHVWDLRVEPLTSEAFLVVLLKTILLVLITNLMLLIVQDRISRQLVDSRRLALGQIDFLINVHSALSPDEMASVFRLCGRRRGRAVSCRTFDPEARSDDSNPGANIPRTVHEFATSALRSDHDSDVFNKPSSRRIHLFSADCWRQQATATIKAETWGRRYLYDWIVVGSPSSSTRLFVFGSLVSAIMLIKAI